MIKKTLNYLFLLGSLLIIAISLLTSYHKPKEIITTEKNTNTTNWLNILKEINSFSKTKPTSLQEIKQWLENKHYPNPLEGVELLGINKNILLNKRIDLSAQRELAEKDNGEDWKDHFPLWTSMDGNCFFHTFSMMLVGNESLSTQLRVAMCLELMKDNSYFQQGNEKADLEEINNCF